jgi:DNA-binding transcriptional ArsR family regulator
MYDRTMDATKHLSNAAFLIADQSRAAMLWSLMGGEARPASELAMVANISPQTASNHLKLLLDAEFLKVTSSGRNRFYSLGDASVSIALESLMAAAHFNRPSDGIARRSAPELVFARTCYDHLAGELGVAILGRLQAAGCLEQHGKEYRLTAPGTEFLQRLGVDVGRAQTKRRRFAHACLDWSHRVPHLGGALGAALLVWMLGNRIVVRAKASRAVRLTDLGQKQLGRHFAIRLTRSGTAIVAES